MSWRVATTEQGIDVMMCILKQEKKTFKPIVICTSDVTIHAVDIRYYELNKYFIIPHAKQEQGEISRLMDKNHMRRFAKEVGFDLLNSINLDPGHFEESEIDMVRYPCLVKPTTSLEGTKRDIKVCCSRDELFATLKDSSTNIHLVEIQDYIRKDVELLLMGCVLRSGEVVMPLYLSKIREDPKLDGNTAWSKCTKEFPGFDVTKVQRFFNLIGYYGIFSLEFLSKGHNHYFLEVNLRNDGNGYAPTYGGVNLPYIWAMDAAGEDVQMLKRQIEKDFYAQVETTDYAYLKCKPYMLIKWLYDTVNTECYLVANKKDPEPWGEIMRHEKFFVRPFHRGLYRFLVNH